MGNLLKIFELLFSFVRKRFWLLLAIFSVVYFFFAIKTHAGISVDKPETYGLGIAVFFVFGITMYFVGHRNAHMEMLDEHNQHAQRCYGLGKIAFESKDYVAAIAKSAEAVGATSGLQEVIDCSRERHLLGASLGSLKHALAAEAHDYAAWYASDDNPDKTLYHFHASVSHFNDKNWEFAALRAQSGLYFIAKHPEARYNPTRSDYDFGTEFRMVKILSSMMVASGSKAFESCREDASWIVANSKDKEKVRYAEQYLAAPAALNTVTDKVAKNYFREGAAGN